MEEHTPSYNGSQQAPQAGFKPFNGEFQAPSNIIPLTSIGMRQAPAKEVDLAAVRARLANSSGKEYWRSLDELADTQEFRELIEREFPRQAPASWAPLERREFLKLMGVGLAMAGLSGCALQPAEKIIPYVKQPEDIIPGKPLFFATAITLGGFARGLLVESHMGRPTKIEGNPDHPASLGKTDAITQAALYSLYDPDRSQQVLHTGNASTWNDLTAKLRKMPGAGATGRGSRLRILTETVTSPTLAAQIKGVLARYPNAQWHQWQPTGRDNVRAGARLAFGADANTIYRFDRAERILSLDSDFLHDEPGSVRYAGEFIDGRRVRTKKVKWENSRTDKDMNRLYVVESTPTSTGAMADHRMPMLASEVEEFARAVHAGVTGAVTSSGDALGNFTSAVVADLKANRGRSLVVAGEHQSPAVHALAHVINNVLGNVGKTVLYTDPIEAAPVDELESLVTLTKDIKGGQVDTLIIIGANPAYDAPFDLGFRPALEKMSKDPTKLTVHLGEYFDETAQWCQWHAPQSHFLETWSDARAFDGTVSIVQPLIAPMYQSRTAHELLAVLQGQLEDSNYHIIRNHWKNQPEKARQDFETNWRKWLNDGVIPNTAARALNLPAPRVPAAASNPPGAKEDSLEINFRPDPTIGDGRHANNGWLQELPKPLTTITWDNAAMVSPKTAEKLQLKTQDVVELELDGSKVKAPVWVLPGHPDNSVTVHLGYGRTRAGKIGTDIGFNAYTLRNAKAMSFASGVKLTRTGERFLLATTQQSHLIDKVTKDGAGKEHVDSMHNRQPIRLLTIDDFKEGHYKVGAPGGHGDEAKHGDDHAKPEAGGHGESNGAHGKADPHAAKAAGGHEAKKQTSIYTDEWPSDTQSQHPELNPNHGKIPHQWGMVIDLNACIGCGACTMACQVENNIPVVGKDEVSRGREMHWIRIDRYYQGGIDDPGTYFQPLPCMHCEKAPCEPVCPVEATTTSSEGINEQTYNRCVGTKYCSNNCPYKVRRFNFLQYSEQDNKTITLMHNPDVTVRARGVMEKCTFCIQRINDGRIRAEKRHGDSDDAKNPDKNYVIEDGEVTTACQQVCPTEGITFGNISDNKSKVAMLRSEPTNYILLEELNTRPRTSYLSRVSNPNPALKSGANTHG